MRPGPAPVDPGKVVTQLDVTPPHRRPVTRPTPPTTLAQTLVNAREAACLTQEDLAERSGVSVRAIRNLETGRTSRPRQQSLLLIARALGL